MTPLSIYLAISLIFVLITLVEFAVVLLLKRKFETVNGKSRVSGLEMDHRPSHQGFFTGGTVCENMTSLEKKQIATAMNEEDLAKPIFSKKGPVLCFPASLITRIDMAVFLLFTFGYLFFNIVYWNKYL